MTYVNILLSVVFLLNSAFLRYILIGFAQNEPPKNTEFEAR